MGGLIRLHLEIAKEKHTMTFYIRSLGRKTIHALPNTCLFCVISMIFFCIRIEMSSKIQFLGVFLIYECERFGANGILSLQWSIRSKISCDICIDFMKYCQPYLLYKSTHFCFSSNQLMERKRSNLLPRDAVFSWLRDSNPGYTLIMFRGFHQIRLTSATWNPLGIPQSGHNIIKLKNPPTHSLAPLDDKGQSGRFLFLKPRLYVQIISFENIIYSCFRYFRLAWIDLTKASTFCRYRVMYT